MSKGLVSVVFRHWTASKRRLLGVLLMCAPLVVFKTVIGDLSWVSMIFFPLVPIGIGSTLHVPYGTLKAFGYRRADFVRINVPIVLIAAAMTFALTVGELPWVVTVLLTTLVAATLGLTLHQQVKEDRSRDHEPVVEKNPGEGQWHMMLFIVALFGVFLWGWKALRPEIAPDMWGSLVVAVPVVAGSVGSNLMTGTQLAEWQAFGKTRRAWRNRTLANGGIGMLGVALFTLVLEPSLVAINVGTFCFTYALMNTTVGAIIAIIVPMTVGGFMRGIEPDAVYLLISGGVLFLIAAVMLWLYPKYANTQKRVELRR
ncbi:hypothetical protein [Corynebacterium sp. SA-MJD20WY100]|uniref:hypothetical protein n=1 Tax=Corynebacterium sp. SA-MJD20WY100 TaxID=3142969 RepID=UPI003221C5D8